MSEEIRDVAPQDVADRNARRMFDRGGNGDGEFGRARAERDDGKPDDEGGYPAFFRDPRRAVYEPIRPLYEERESHDEKKYPKIEHKRPPPA